MVTCSVPYQQAGKFAGVATTDIRLDNVATFMQQQGNSTGGYAFVVDKQGQILYFRRPTWPNIKPLTIWRKARSGLSRCKTV